MADRAERPSALLPMKRGWGFFLLESPRVGSSPTSAVSIVDALAKITRASGLSSRFLIATGSMGRRVSMDDPRKKLGLPRAKRR
jgi:hypothetical protein